MAISKYKFLNSSFATALKTLISLFIAVSLIFGLVAFYFFNQIPTEKDLRSCFTTKMYGVQLCPKSKNYVPLKSISPILKKTIVLTEDSLFYQHNGFDWGSIEKSARENFEKGKFARGGSTISQQLAKNLFLTKEKSLMRKFMEALITSKIERTLSKNEILEKYLNVIEFGKDLYGIGPASRFYFDKSAAELNTAESAFLAMLLPNPKGYSRSFYKKELTPFARKRMEKIISDLFQYHIIEQTEYDIALNQLDSLFQEKSLEVEFPEFFDESIPESDLPTDE